MVYYKHREQFIPYDIFEKIYKNLWTSLEEYDDEEYAPDCVDIYSDRRDPWFLCYYMLEYTTYGIENGSIKNGFKYALNETTPEKRLVVYKYLKHRQTHITNIWETDEMNMMLEAIGPYFKRKITI